MKYETIHNLQIPKIGFGCWTIGGYKTPDTELDGPPWQGYVRRWTWVTPISIQPRITPKVIQRNYLGELAQLAIG